MVLRSTAVGVCAAILGTAAFLVVTQIAFRTRRAASTAKAALQRDFAERVNDVSRDFNENLGGTENGVGYLVVLWLSTFILGIANAEMRTVRMVAAGSASIYSIVMGYFVLRACMEAQDIGKCSSIIAPNTGPYGNCDAQTDLRDELQDVTCPALNFYVIVCSLGLAVASASAYTENVVEKTAQYVKLKTLFF